jgi:predicted AlkP superfamily pyrophosphatase or phosphodiesterase
VQFLRSRARNLACWNERRSEIDTRAVDARLARGRRQELSGFRLALDRRGINDEGKTDIASYLIEKARPTLLCLHLTEVDSAQHKHGLWSPEAITAIENTDRQLERVIHATEHAGTADSTAFVIASDHGFAEVNRLVRPGALLRQAGLIRLDDKGKVSSWDASVLPNGGSSSVYLRDSTDAALQAATRKAFEDKTLEPNSGIGRIIPHAEIASLGGDPEAFIALDAAPGTTFGAGYGDYDAPVPVKATHGYDPNRPEMRASLVLFGASVAKGKLSNARIVDVAPTVAAWLHLPLEGVGGRPLQVVDRGAAATGLGAS